MKEDNEGKFERMIALIFMAGFIFGITFTLMIIKPTYDNSLVIMGCSSFFLLFTALRSLSAKRSEGKLENVRQG